MQWLKSDSHRIISRVQALKSLHHPEPFRTHSSPRGHFHPDNSDAPSCPGVYPFPKTSALHKIALATDHLKSPPSDDNGNKSPLDLRLCVRQQQQITLDLRLQLRSSILPRIQNVSTPFSLGSYKPRQIFLHAIPAIKHQKSRLLQTNQRVQFVSLRESRLYHPPMHADQTEFKQTTFNKENLDLLLP